MPAINSSSSILRANYFYRLHFSVIDILNVTFTVKYVELNSGGSFVFFSPLYFELKLNSHLPNYSAGKIKKSFPLRNYFVLG